MLRREQNFIEPNSGGGFDFRGFEVQLIDFTIAQEALASLRSREWSRFKEYANNSNNWSHSSK